MTAFLVGACDSSAVLFRNRSFIDIFCAISLTVYTEVSKLSGESYHITTGAEIKYCRSEGAWVFMHPYIRKSRQDSTVRAKYSSSFLTWHYLTLVCHLFLSGLSLAASFARYFRVRSFVRDWSLDCLGRLVVIVMLRTQIHSRAYIHHCSFTCAKDHSSKPDPSVHHATNALQYLNA